MELNGNGTPIQTSHTTNLIYISEYNYNDDNYANIAATTTDNRRTYIADKDREELVMHPQVKYSRAPLFFLSLVFLFVYGLLLHIASLVTSLVTSLFSRR